MKQAATHVGDIPYRTLGSTAADQIRTTTDFDSTARNPEWLGSTAT
jgi:hypothetical protein